MGTISTSASDLGGPIAVSRPLVLEGYPRRDLAEYGPILRHRPTLVFRTRPIPELGLGGQFVDFATRQALQTLLGAEPTGQAIEVLRNELIAAFNDAPRGTQYAVIGFVGIGSLAYCVANAAALLESLGNSKFSIEVPVEALGLEGVKLTLQIALDDFRPRLGGVILQLSNVFGGELRIASDFRAGSIHWRRAIAAGNGFFRLQLDGIGAGSTRFKADLRMTF